MRSFSSVCTVETSPHITALSTPTPHGIRKVPTLLTRHTQLSIISAATTAAAAAQQAVVEVQGLFYSGREEVPDVLC